MSSKVKDSMGYSLMFTLTKHLGISKEHIFEANGLAAITGDGTFVFPRCNREGPLGGYILATCPPFRVTAAEKNMSKGVSAGRNGDVYVFIGDKPSKKLLKEELDL